MPPQVAPGAMQNPEVAQALPVQGFPGGGFNPAAMQHAMANPAQMMNMIQAVRMQNP